MIRTTQASPRFTPTFFLSVFSVTTCVLVILLFLLKFVDTPLYRHAAPELPITSHADAIELSERDLRVTIWRDGTITMSHVAVPPSEVEAAFRELLAISTDRPLVIAADHRAPYASVEAVVKAAREVGFSDIRLLTGPYDTWEAIRRSAPQ